MGVPDHRVLTWNGARAELRLNQLSRGYTDVWINVEKAGRDFTLRMPNGDVLRASEIRLATITPHTIPLLTEKLAGGRIRVQTLFDSGNCSSFWGYTGGGYAFEFQDDHLVSVGARADPSFAESCRPGLGNAAGSVMYAMPFSEKQLVDLFGPFLRKEDVWGGL